MQTLQRTYEERRIERLGAWASFFTLGLEEDIGLGPPEIQHRQKKANGILGYIF